MAAVTTKSSSPSFAPKNLVLQGGGAKGIAYVGVAEALEEQGIYQQVERVAGTSAGSIFAALMALGYSPADMKKLVLDTDFTKFEDGAGPVRTFVQTLDKYGVYRGDYFLRWMKKAVKNCPTKGMKAEATFADLRSKGCLDLHVFATDLNEKDVQEFSFQTTPNVIVAEAVRASMSIPLAFQAFKFSKGLPNNNHLFVDGGIVLNYPIDTFDSSGKANPETLGFAFHDPANMGKDGKDMDLKYGHIVEYGKILYETMRQAQNVEFYNSPTEKARTCKVDDLGISAFNFGLSKEEKIKLMASGNKGTTSYIQKKKREVLQKKKTKTTSSKTKKNALQPQDVNAVSTPTA